MSGNNVRQEAINGVTSRIPTATTTTEPLSSIWASDVFNLATMEECLSKSAFKAMKKTVQTGAPLDPATADIVAAAMKDWALAERRQVLLAHLLPDDQHHGREARRLHRHQPRRQRDHRVHRQPADQGRARRLVVPERQPAHDQRGARLHGLGSDQPGLRHATPRTARR